MIEVFLRAVTFLHEDTMDYSFPRPVAAPCIAIAGLFLLSACSGVRTQSPREVAQDVSHGVHAHARQECVKHRDSTQYFECRKRADENYKAWRDERGNIANGK